MFENMSDREKKLALIVGSILPIVLLFFAFMWFFDRYESNDTEIANLMSQIEEQEALTTRGMLASKRNFYYRDISLPVETNRVRSVYRPWLDDLIIKTCGMSHNGVKMKDNVGVLKQDRDTVARRSVFTTRPKGTLPQLIQFLHEFYSADHLHRINKLSIKPEVLKKRGKKVLTGELNMEIEVETLSLEEGPERLATFPVWQRELPSIDGYNDKILARNIFGPANNAPSLNDPTSKSLNFKIAKEGEDVTGKYVTVQLSAEDADKDDILGFELLEQSGDENNVGVVLGDQPRAANVRKISLRIPKQAKPIKIPISLKVFDDGLPAKEDQIDFKVVFEAPDPEPKPTPKAEPIPIDIAKHTYVRGLNKGNDGRFRVFIVEQLKSQKLMPLSVDDSIDIDNQTWKVVGIDAKTVTFEVDGKRQSFKNGSNLAQPMKTL